MKNKTLSKIAICLLLLMLPAMSLFALLGGGKADAKTFASEYFTYTDATATEAVKSDGGKAGLLVKGFKSGATAQSVDALCGRLDIDFSVAGEGLKSFSLDIIDLNNVRNSFSVKISTENGELNAGVSAFGKTAGISYMNGATMGKTADKNAIGEYTVVKEELLGNRLSFDPETMSVCISDSEGEKKVWDLFYSVNDRFDIGGTADSVGLFRFGITFDRTDGNGGVIIHAIDGQRFDTLFISGAGVNNAAPVIYADAALKAVAGEPYLIPEPMAYDVSDGTVENVTVAVMSGGVTVEEAKTYQSGMTFTPQSTDAFTLRYSAVDAHGLKTVKDVAVAVTNGKGGASIEYSHATVSGALGKGSKLVLPVAHLTSEQAVKRERSFAAAVTVLKDNVALDGYNGAILPENTEITLREAGEYKLVYTSANAQLPFADAFEFTVKEELPAASAVSLRASYETGEEITLGLPEFSLDGESKTASPVLVFPSGAAYSGLRHKLNEAGVYELKLGAELGGKTYTEIYKFNALSPAYTADEYDFAGYGTTPYLEGKEGLNVSIDRKGVFELNTTVNLAGLTKEDRLLSLYITPETAGTFEASGVEVTVTDVYDESNFITVQSINEVGEPRLSYVRAGHHGGTKVGYMGSSSWDYSFIHKGNEYGRVVRMSAAGIVPETYSEITPFEIYYDYEEKAVYIGSTGVAGWANRLVCDLDNPDDFTDVFKGFKTGEVKITVRAYTPRTEKFNFFIEEVAGVNLADKFARDGAAEIKVNLPEGELPVALAGTPYPVFDATAVAPGAGEVPLSVYAVLGYGSKSACYFDVTDGKFVPVVKGDYTLVYTAANRFGEITAETVTVTAVKELEPLAVTVEPALNGVTGKSVTLPEPTVTGGSGFETVKTEYTAPGGSTGVVENGAFVPELAGDYTVKYTVTDYIGNTAAATLTLTVASASAPVFDGEPELPAAFINGDAYTLPELYATDYSSGVPEKIKAEVSVKYGETPVEVTDGTFVPEVSNSRDTVTVAYAAGGAEPLVYDIPVMIIKYTDDRDGITHFPITEHFVTNNATVAATKPEYDESAGENVGRHGVSLTANGEDAWGEYVLPLVAGVFDIEFEVEENENTNQIDLYLSDWYNPEISVKLSLFKGEKPAVSSKENPTSILRINDSDAKYTAEGSFFSVSNARFVLSYKYALRRISDGAKMNALIETTRNGDAFEGFESGYLRMRFALPDGAKITLRYLNGQRMSAETSDGVSPSVFVADGEKRTYRTGDEIAVPAAYVGDVLDSKIDYFLVTVRDSKNNIVTDKNGVKLENVAADGNYAFTAQTAGVYNIIYGRADGSGNSDTTRYTVRVVDIAAPVITLSADSIGEVKKGDTVSLPTATVTGATSDTVSIYVFGPDGMAFPVTDGKYVVPDKAGKYTVKYVALDAFGNMAVEAVEFTAV